MSLTTTETLNSQIPLRQVGNLISSSSVFPKQSLEQIADTKISLCNISFSDFVNVFSFEIVNIAGDEFSEQIVFKLEYANKFFVQLRLNGYWELGEEPKFQLIDVDWNFEEKENNPTSAFLLETFKAILSLSNKVEVEIPSIDYYFGVSVPSPLNTISEILQNRQLAYRLMVIEKAFKISLPFPRRFIDGKEVENIAFCYHAIIEREFEWLCDSLTFFPLSKTEYIDLLPSINKPFPLTFPTSDEKRIIFGKLFNLGQFLIKIKQATVVNYKEARKNLIALDDKPVEVIIKSVNGKMKYTATKTIPTLPKDAFTNDIQKLIDLNEKFNSIFLERYFKLAASTLEGLSEKQKKAITERPKLSIKGFD